MNHGTPDDTQPRQHGNATISIEQQVAALQAALAALEKQIGRAGREQFKANTLAETQATQLAEALDRLREADERREAELATLRQRNTSDRAEARQEVARAILPSLDGLDEAMRAGQMVLLQRASIERRPDSLLRSLLGLGTTDSESREAVTLRAALNSWLQGLTFVRRRLLDVLAAEGIAPIEATGQPFDPREHVAVEVVPTSDTLPADTVAYELRRGYTANGRVLRPAEVAVAGRS